MSIYVRLKAEAEISAEEQLGCYTDWEGLCQLKIIM